MYQTLLKRPLDILFSVMALLLLSPVYLILTLSGMIFMRGNPFFIQKRPGKKDKNGNEKIFSLVKFRTMTAWRDENGKLLPDEQRLTRYGRFLRSTSLDELPEFWNILKGDMSLVGPRPLLVSYLDRYSERERHRHDVRPGLTGYAQVSGRNAVTWEERFEKDLYYVEHISFLFDLKILLCTLAVVWKRENISSETSATMEEFKGHKQEARRIVIIGAGGHGKVVADLALKNGYTDIRFLDDLITGDCIGFPIVGKSADMEGFDDGKTDFIIAIGDHTARKRIAEAHPVRFTTLIHPSAEIGYSAILGEGTVVMACAVINAGAVIGKHGIINSRAVVEHDDTLGDYVHIAPAAALGGTVTIGEGTQIGIGATVKNGISVCHHCIIGAGAVVVRDITEQGIYVGIPARKLKSGHRMIERER